MAVLDVCAVNCVRQAALASDAVLSDSIKDGEIARERQPWIHLASSVNESTLLCSGADLADAAVDTVKLADGSVTAAKLHDR